MEESFRSLYTQFINPDIPRYVRRSYRLIPDIGSPGINIRDANFEQWHRMGLDELIQDRLAVVAYEDKDYAIISQVKNATDTDYDIMFICLPKGENEIHHLPCFLPPYLVPIFYECLNRGVEALLQVAASHEDRVRRVYVHHHVGPFELNGYNFNISFPQLHMHVMAVTDRDLAQSERGISRQGLRESDNLHTYTDPTVLIAKDLFEHQFGRSTELDHSTSSLVLQQRPVDFEITPEEMTFLPDLYYEWHKWWGMIAMCFSMLELDGNNRLLLSIAPQERREYIEQFVEMFPFFSQQSLTILDFLADHSRPFDPQSLKSATYAGIAGALGWVHNTDSGLTEFRFGPRLLTSSKKMGASDGFYVGIKDKSKMFPQAEERLAVQREIFTALASLIKANPICP